MSIDDLTWSCRLNFPLDSELVGFVDGFSMSVDFVIADLATSSMYNLKVMVRFLEFVLEANDVVLLVFLQILEQIPVVDSFHEHLLTA